MPTATIQTFYRPFLIKSALAIAIGLTGMPLLASGASAQDIEFSIGRDGPRIRTINRGDGPRNRNIERCDPDIDDCDERRDLEDRPVKRGCSENRALNKAERMGIYRARVASADRRTIQVRGRTPDGDRAYVTFSRRSGCPVLEY